LTKINDSEAEYQDSQGSSFGRLSGDQEIRIRSNPSEENLAGFNDAMGPNLN